MAPAATIIAIMATTSSTIRRMPAAMGRSTTAVALPPLRRCSPECVEGIGYDKRNDVAQYGTYKCVPYQLCPNDIPTCLTLFLCKCICRRLRQHFNILVG